MKLTCQQSELNSALSLVGRAISTRPSHPVLANVLLDANPLTGTAQLTGSDLSLGVSASLACEIEAGGKITLPARLLTDIVSRLPEGGLTLESGDDFGVAITCSSGKYQLQGLSAEEFPALPTIDDGESFELSSEDLLSGLKNTLFAASGDELKQVLTGVHLKIWVEDDDDENAKT